MHRVSPLSPAGRGRTNALVLAAILALALVLRLHDLTSASLWLDEILTVELSVGRGYPHLDLPQDQLIHASPDFIALAGAPPAWRIWTSLDRDVHPPLFYFVLRLWRALVGDGDFRLRLLSVAISLGAIVMLYLAVKPLSGAVPALWASSLMALAGPQIEYAQEVRSYMLLVVALLAAVAIIARIEKLGPTRWRFAALVASLLASLLTHYASIPAVAALLLYTRLRLRGHAASVAAGAFLIAALVYAGTWGPLWLRQMHGFHERVGFTVASGTPAQALLRAAELPLRFFTNAPIKPSWIGALGLLLYILPVLRLRRRPELLLWWILFVGYVGFVLTSDLLRQADAPGWIRYTLAASPAAYALAATLLADARGWKRHVVPALLGVACVLALPAAYTRWKADWRLLASGLASEGSGHDVLVFQSRDALDWQARCMFLCLRYYAPRPAGTPVAFLGAPAGPDLLRSIDGRDAWLFGGGQDTPTKLLPGWKRMQSQYVPLAGTVTRMRADAQRTLDRDARP